MENSDIVIQLKAWLRDQGKSTLTLKFSDIDNELGLIAGSAKANINIAAKKAGFLVIEEGETMIELNRPTSASFRIERG